MLVTGFQNRNISERAPSQRRERTPMPAQGVDEDSAGVGVEVDPNKGEADRQPEDGAPVFPAVTNQLMKVW